jgi:hypothetical protein
MSKLTPTEYAQQLIDKYAINVVIFSVVNGEELIPKGLLTTKSSVKLAIMEIDAIIDDLGEVKQYVDDNLLFYFNNERCGYLESVKKELLNAL